MTPIYRYLEKGELPESTKEATKLRLRGNGYTIINGVLYKQAFTLLLLPCVNQEEVDYVLREIHHGIVGAHKGAKSLAFKAIRQGYYWPTMIVDARELVKRM